MAHMFMSFKGSEVEVVYKHIGENMIHLADV